MKIENKYIIGTIAILLAVILLQCNHTRNVRDVLEEKIEEVVREKNNVLAMNSKIDTLTLENGELVSTIKSYEYDIKRLKGKNDTILKDYKDLLDMYEDLEGINSILKADLNITDSLLAVTTSRMINDTTAEINHAIDDEYSPGNTLRLTGVTKVSIDSENKIITSNGSIFNIEQSIRLRAILNEVDGQPSVSISTSYPNLTITDIENINLINNMLKEDQIPDTRTGLGVGLGLGYGINYNRNGIGIGPSLTFGVYWTPKILRFN